jgi:hypothetical protein
MKFCPHCGTPIGAEKKIRPRHEEEKACFGPRGSGGGMWGAVSAGVFIIGLGILWLLDIFWPGILFLIGLMIFIGALVAYTRK